MKIAFLVLCHIDEEHIKRLANKLTEFKFFDVFIHVDLKSDIERFKKLLENNYSVYFVKDRYDVSWGGYSAINATMSLIETAYNNYDYDRYVLLQGLDYPLKSNDELYKFFCENSKVQYIRGCNISASKDKYFYSKCRYYLFYDNRNILKKILNKMSFLFNLKFKSGYIYDEAKYDVYWGSAQWALTGECIKYILEFHKSHKKFNDYFKYVFAADELFFTTIVFNSKYSKFTSSKGPEQENRGLENWRNLHYFEYGSCIRVFTKEDFDMLIETGCLFFRKATTAISSPLLDMIDTKHNKFSSTDV